VGAGGAAAETAAVGTAPASAHSHPKLDKSQILCRQCGSAVQRAQIRKHLKSCGKTSAGESTAAISSVDEKSTERPPKDVPVPVKMTTCRVCHQEIPRDDIRNHLRGGTCKPAKNSESSVTKTESAETVSATPPLTATATTKAQEKRGTECRHCGGLVSGSFKNHLRFECSFEMDKKKVAPGAAAPLTAAVPDRSDPARVTGNMKSNGSIPSASKTTAQAAPEKVMGKSIGMVLCRYCNRTFSSAVIRRHISQECTALDEEIVLANKGGPTPAARSTSVATSTVLPEVVHTGTQSEKSAFPALSKVDAVGKYSPPSSPRDMQSNGYSTLASTDSQLLATQMAQLQLAQMAAQQPSVMQMTAQSSFAPTPAMTFQAGQMTGGFQSPSTLSGGYQATASPGSSYASQSYSPGAYSGQSYGGDGSGYAGSSFGSSSPSFLQPTFSSAASSRQSGSRRGSEGPLSIVKPTSQREASWSASTSEAQDNGPDWGSPDFDNGPRWD
jgi:hypothetical protein